MVNGSECNVEKYKIKQKACQGWKASKNNFILESNTFAKIILKKRIMHLVNFIAYINIDKCMCSSSMLYSVQICQKHCSFISKENV